MTDAPVRAARLVAPLLAGILAAGFDQPAAAQCTSAPAGADLPIGEFFQAQRVTGTFVLLDVRTGTCKRFDAEHARRRMLPASTFKIFNTMAALDAGAVPDPDHVLKWDGVERWLQEWNEDQTMRQAFRRSTVWFYQELARRIGETRMRDWLERERYGNADPAGGIDAFWLNGGLRISADEQADFLARLLRRDLGFSKRAQDVAAELLVMERTAGYELAGKTGWTESEGNQLGWYVGWVERAGAAHIYALNFESPDPEFPVREARETLLRLILARLQLLPQPE